MQIKTSTRGSFWLRQSFHFHEMYFLSSGVPAKTGIAEDLSEADEIGRKAVGDFIDSLLVENMSFTTPLNTTS